MYDTKQVSKFSLEEIFNLIDAGKVWFSARSASTYRVIAVYQNSASPKSQEEADRFILETIKKLTPAHFYRTISIFGDPRDLADEYGIQEDGFDWYVKFQIDADGELNEISFHLSTKPFVTVGGMKISKGNKE